MKKLKYPYYRDNPDLNLRTVIDVRGDIEYFANCKKIGDVYLVKNIDLELVEEKWIKKDYKIYDHETNTYKSDTYGLKFGIVSIDTYGNLIYGHFSPNPYTNCVVFTSLKGVECINYKLLSEQYFSENPMDGYFYYLKEFTDRDIVRKKVIVNNNHAPYNIEDNSAMYSHRKELYLNSQFPIDRDIRFAAKYIKGLTFGVELETINGQLPTHLLNTYGIIICKDGSIKDENGNYPPEYVTVPLEGEKGIQSLRNTSIEIAKRSEIDIKCSYHLHIGGIKPERLFLVSLFKLCTKIQGDVFKMFPYYKTKPEGIKAKNYCKKLPLVLNNYVEGTAFNKYINNVYTDIYCFLSGGIRPDSEFNTTTKVNPWGEGKWNIKTRYYWINFVNLVFHKRETIEFRIHTPTLNSDKIINWLFMSAAIIKFAEKYPKRCVSAEPISFIDVLNYYKNNSNTNFAEMLSNNLILYYNSKVALFQKDYEQGDYISKHDITNDKKYNFNALKIN